MDEVGLEACTVPCTISACFGSQYKATPMHICTGVKSSWSSQSRWLKIPDPEGDWEKMLGGNRATKENVDFALLKESVLGGKCATMCK